MSDYFIFDDIDTRDYEGILVYFNSVDTTPKRVGEFIEIPNRNGSFFLDGGRYEDVVHTYDIIALSKEHASDLINALASKVGYFRLQDSFNPDEYYSAVLDSEIEPVVTTERDKLTFKIMFTRKPQRWLTSGETAVTVTSGDTLTNPTLFESGPLLEVEGYGNLNFNGYTISIENAVMGEVLLANPKTFSTNYTDIIFSKLAYETGDTITMGAGTINWDMRTINGYRFWYTEVTATDTNSDFNSWVYLGDIRRVTAITGVAAQTFTAGTNKTVTNTATATFPIGLTQDTQSNITVTCTQTITYTASYSSTQSRIRIQYSLSFSSSGKLDYSFSTSSSKTGDITVNSTQSLLGHPTYIDCDLGEAYKITSGVYVSLNSKINLGSKLPMLASGSNTVTYDNTITSVKITPRWWKV